MLANKEHDPRCTQARDVFRERGERRSCHLPVSYLGCVLDGTHLKEGDNTTRMAGSRV